MASGRPCVTGVHSPCTDSTYYILHTSYYIYYIPVEEKSYVERRIRVVDCGAAPGNEGKMENGNWKRSGGAMISHRWTQLETQTPCGCQHGTAVPATTTTAIAIATAVVLSQQHIMGSDAQQANARDQLPAANAQQPQAPAPALEPVQVKQEPLAQALTQAAQAQTQGQLTQPLTEDDIKKLQDKKGRSMSCYLCQKRKQKCDQRSPSCTNCLRSKYKCIQPPKYGESLLNAQNASNDYTRFLEKKIRQLEKLLDLKAKTKFGQPNITNEEDPHLDTDISISGTAALVAVPTATSSGRKMTLNDEKILKYKKISPLLSSTPDLPAPSSSGECDSGNIPCSASTANLKETPPQSKNEVHDQDNAEGIMDQPASTFMRNHASSYSKSCLKKYNLTEILKLHPAPQIDAKFSKNFISIYFKMLQYKFPLLLEKEIFTFNNTYYTTPPPDDNDLASREAIDYHFNCSRLFFIYAIAALLYKSSGRYRGPNPFSFFATALRHFILLSDNIDNFLKLDLLILMCLFLIRADKNSNNVFLIIQDAIHISVDLKLHKSSSYSNIPDTLRDLRMRKFWCVYMLERSILVSISKPFLLPESEVDEDLPMFDYEPSTASNPKGKIFFINQSIKIKRLESRFIEELNIANSTNPMAQSSVSGSGQKPKKRSKNKQKHSVTSSSSQVPTQPSKSQLPRVEIFFQELQNWRNECQGFNTNGIENQTLLLNYYKAVRHLIQPYLELLDPNDKLFKECQAAAGQICQSIKNYHSKTFSGFSLLNIQLVFIAGITLVYCLWLQRNRDDMRRKLLGDDKKHTRPTVSEDLFRGLDDLRGCSVSLYVMSERTKFALSYRDIFEEIMNATIGNLILRCGPDSSEILYRGTGLPPAIFRKPMKHFQIESNYIEKSADDKLEDEERIKRRGHLTRSAIPKGLSHLLLHPPGFEDEKESELCKEQPQPHQPATPMLSTGGNSSGRNSFDDKEKEKDKENRQSQSTHSDLNNRILPPPIKMPLMPPQSRLTSSLSAKPFDSHYNTTALNGAKRKYSRAESDSESAASSYAKSPSTLNMHLNMNHSNLLSPMTGLQGLSGQGTSMRSFPTPNLASTPLYGSNSSSSTPAAVPPPPPPQPLQPSTLGNGTDIGRYRFFRSPQSLSSNGQISKLNNGNGTSSSSPSSTASASAPANINANSYVPGMHSENIPQNSIDYGANANLIPQIYPFVGGTTAMISNISTWTEQSGQQVPQTGLSISQQAQGSNDSNAYPNFDANLNSNVYVGGNGSNGGGFVGGFPGMNVAMAMSQGNQNQNVSNQTHTQNVSQGYSVYYNGLHDYARARGQQAHQQNNGNVQNVQNPVQDSFNSLFDVVESDDFWSFNNDLGFLS